MIVFSRLLKWRPIDWVFGGHAGSVGRCSVRYRRRAGCISSACPVSDGTPPSRHGSQPLGQSAMVRFAQSGDGFGPAEGLLDPLAYA